MGGLHTCTLDEFHYKTGFDHIIKSLIPHITQWVKMKFFWKIVADTLIRREMRKKNFRPQNVPLEKKLRKIFKTRFHILNLAAKISA